MAAWHAQLPVQPQKPEQVLLAYKQMVFSDARNSPDQYLAAMQNAVCSERLSTGVQGKESHHAQTWEPLLLLPIRCPPGLQSPGILFRGSSWPGMPARAEIKLHVLGNFSVLCMAAEGPWNRKFGLRVPKARCCAVRKCWSLRPTVSIWVKSLSRLLTSAHKFKSPLKKCPQLSEKTILSPGV